MEDDYNPYRESAEIAHSNHIEREKEIVEDETGDDGTPLPLESTPITDEFLDEEGDVSGGDFNDPDLITAR